MAKAIFPLSAGSRYVCSDCNQMVFRRKGAQWGAHAENRCDRCGHEMIAVRPMASAFGLGIGWACILILGIAVGSRMAPDLKNMIVTVGVAICGALACNKLFEATRNIRGTEPAASISRQTLAEATGAFLALLIGSAILLR